MSRRIPAALARYFLKYDAKHVSQFRNIVNVEGILWTYARTGDKKLLDLAVKGAKQEEKGYMLPGLGKLVKKQQAARTGRNPATGETIKIKAKKVVKFRLAKACKDAVLAK